MADCYEGEREGGAHGRTGRLEDGASVGLRTARDERGRRSWHASCTGTCIHGEGMRSQSNEAVHFDRTDVRRQSVSLFESPLIAHLKRWKAINNECT